MVKNRRMKATGQPALFADMFMLIPDAEPAPAPEPAPEPPPLFAVAAQTPPEPEPPAAVVDADPTGSGWYVPLNTLASRGQLAERPGGLAGLAAARAEHWGQFFTPNPVVSFMWRLMEPAWADVTRGKVSVFDNSFGSGRMFSLADPSVHYLAGIELDAELVSRVQEAVSAAGFEFQLEAGSMEEFRPGPHGGNSFHLGMINPAFSLLLDNYLVETFECNAYGKYGPRSSAKTHLYALAQALKACDVVFAVMPRSFAETAKDETSIFNPRLHSIYHLPRGAFRTEGTEWDVSLFLYQERPRRTGNYYGTPQTLREFWLEDLEPREEHFPPEGDIYFGSGSYSFPEIKRATAELGRTAITLPVTGDKTVRVCHNGRRVVLKFKCGLAQAKVLNRVWEGRVSHNRGRDEGKLPRGVEYRGEGQLDLECYLVQDNPLAAFERFVEKIRGWGFSPEVDPGIWGYLRRRVREVKLLNTPLRHWVYTVDGGLKAWVWAQKTVRGVCKESHPVRTRMGGYYGSTPVEPGAAHEFTAEGHGYSYTTAGGREGFITGADLMKFYDFPDFAEAPEGWQLAHAGLKAKFPDRAAQLERKAKRLGLDKILSWGYQFDDLIECGLRKGNTVIGWGMGLGKARLSLSLCLLGEGKHNLIVLESRLVNEMLDEIRGLGLPPSEWQVIEKLEHCRQLRRINIVSYNRLRTAEVKRYGRKRFVVADALRRRIHTMVVDEGHNIKNVDQADQTIAAWRVAARRRYVLTGTPIDNYPRDILPLMQFAAGDGVAHQPYGLRRAFLAPSNLTNMNTAVRGVDVFKDLFMILEWVTHEFEDGLRVGGKREIPKIKDVRAFREMVAPIVKRRLMEEPEVAAYVNIPESRQDLSVIAWDVPHLKHYVRVSEEFVNWYKNLSDREKKGLSMIAVLAKIQAVIDACNDPRQVKGAIEGKILPYVRRTSKQRFALARLKQLVAEGHKVVFVAQSPPVLEMFERLLAEAGIPSVLFHGGISIKKRVDDMDKKFRKGPVPVLLATKGCLQTGYNIWQADRIVFYDRAWTPKVEQQTAARLLRPQQTREVVIEFLELQGSIDSYQKQMVEFKAVTMKAGLDYGEDTTDVKDFLHIETILDAFVKDFEARTHLKITGRNLTGYLDDEQKGEEAA